MESFRYLFGLVAAAFVMGAAFDIYNTVLGSTKWLRWLRPALDVLFWFVSACLVYYVAFVTDKGELRLYTLVILLIGFGLYRLLAHRLVVGGAHGFVRLIRTVVLLCVRLVNILVMKPICALLKVIWMLLKFFYLIGIRLENALCWVADIILKALFFPVRWMWPKNASWPLKIQQHWEDFWGWLSKRILNGSERV